jgi:hypothetical protein
MLHNLNITNHYKIISFKNTKEVKIYDSNCYVYTNSGVIVKYLIYHAAKHEEIIIGFRFKAATIIVTIESH